MNEEAPYQSPLLDHVIHMSLRGIESMRYEDSDKALKDISLVGMLLPDSGAVADGKITADDIYSEDSDMLRRSFHALSSAGIATHPEARFQIYNILPPVRSDFLLAALDYDDVDYPKNDLAIMMYLPKYGTTPMDRFYMGYKGFRSFDTKELYGDQSWRQYTSASHLHHEFHIWAEAAERLGSKIILTLGGVDDEITTQHFEGHSAFTTLIDSEANQRKKGQHGRSNLGVIMRRDCMQGFKEIIEPSSEIGIALDQAL